MTDVPVRQYVRRPPRPNRLPQRQQRIRETMATQRQHRSRRAWQVDCLMYGLIMVATVLFIMGRY